MSSPDIQDDDREAVAAVMRTRSLSMGNKILEFERIFKEYTGAQHAIAVNSGTAGLHLCVRAAGVSDGDLVITTPYSFVASSNVILYERAIPVFVDVDESSGNIDVSKMQRVVEDILTGGDAARKWLPPKGVEDIGTLRAILPVDVFGQPPDMDPLIEVARRFELPIIEDSCEALGAEYKGRKAGTLGDFGVFAFYPNKQITTGEGGVIITDDVQAAGFMRALRNQGRAPGDTWLQHTHLGYNYRLDEMSAALGLSQMSRIDDLLADRNRVAEWYAERLEDLPQVQPFEVLPATSRMSWFVYVVLFKPDVDRDAVARELEGQGIPTRPYFSPIHLQPYMVAKFGYKLGDFPVTEELGRRGLALPFSGVMLEDSVEQVCQALASAMMA